MVASSAHDPTRARALLDLAERYGRLGLDAAADAALARAVALDLEDDEAPARRAVLALARGDAAGAHAAAADAVRRKPSVRNRLLAGRAAYAHGELAAARFAYSAVMQAPAATAADRAAACAGRAEVALAEGDGAGARAQVFGAIGERPRDVEVIERIARAAAAAGATAGALERADDQAADPSAGPFPHLLRAELIAAQQARGEGDAGTSALSAETDDRVEAALRAALASDAAFHAARFRLALRLLRRRYRDPDARGRALAELLHLERDLIAAGAGPAELARVAYVRGTLHEDDPAEAAQAEKAYVRALALQPAHAAAEARLGSLALAAGRHDEARRRLLAAVAADPLGEAAYHVLARALVAERGLGGLAGDAGAVIEAGRRAPAGAAQGGVEGEMLARLLAAAVQATRELTFEGLFTRGHQLKNVIGVIGARLRAVLRDVSDARLGELQGQLGGLYDDWAAYLRTMKEDEPRREVVAVNALAADVAAEIQSAGRAVRVRVEDGLPDVRGDRARLREALRNVVANAIEAQGEGGPPVELATRALPAAGSGAPRRVALEVRDRGPGIAPADLRRIFAPGFTTKPSGSGFGLTIAERVVAAHHGRVEIESEIGRGTTVRLILPADIAAPPRAAVAGGEQ